MCIECDDQESCIYEPDEHKPSAFEGEQPEDSIGRNYNPYAGSRTKTDGRCNARLTRWEDRYGEKRYCTQLPTSTHSTGEDLPVCGVHKDQVNLMERAKDLTDTGVFTKTPIYLFDKLDAAKQVLALSNLDSLQADAEFDYAINLSEYEVDLSDSEYPIPDSLQELADDDSVLEVGVPVPSQHGHRFLALWLASLNMVKQLNIDERILEDGLLVSKTVATADDEGVITDSLSDDEEHPMHLTQSRLAKDNKEYLKFGGVQLEDESEVTVDIGGAQEVIMDLDDVAPNHVSEDAMEMPLHDEEVLDDAEEDFLEDELIDVESESDDGDDDGDGAEG